ncbi:MAG: DUF4911 domain-containing protein [Deltaproteobacteria bacterium]|nr:DUF4911 domain-containing protein [Deltaproteobacteria bacterium]
MLYWFYKVHKPDINMIKVILESYENMVQVSTIDESIPKIQITVAPDFKNDVADILEDLKSRFYLERLTDEDETKSQGRY